MKSMTQKGNTAKFTDIETFSEILFDYVSKKTSEEEKQIKKDELIQC